MQNCEIQCVKGYSKRSNWKREKTIHVVLIKYLKIKMLRNKLIIFIKRWSIVDANIFEYTIKIIFVTYCQFYVYCVLSLQSIQIDHICINIIMVKSNKKNTIHQHQNQTDHPLRLRNRKMLVFRQDYQESEQESTRKKLSLKEKNKESARRSRDNKNRYVLELEKRVFELTIQNQRLTQQLKSYKCSRISQKNNHILQTNQSCMQQSIPIKIEDQDLYDRLSIKSNNSFSNYIMLTIILIIGIFGCYDVNKDFIKTPASLYNVEQLKAVGTRTKITQNLIFNDKNRISKKHQVFQHQTGYKLLIYDNLDLQLQQNKRRQLQLQSNPQSKPGRLKF